MTDYQTNRLWLMNQDRLYKMGVTKSIKKAKKRYKRKLYIKNIFVNLRNFLKL